MALGGICPLQRPASKKIRGGGGCEPDVPNVGDKIGRGGAWMTGGFYVALPTGSKGGLVQEGSVTEEKNFDRR